MILKMFVIYDSKAEAYLPPFFVKSKGEAIRAIQSLIEDPQHNFHKYAEDFTLFEAGSWNDENAKFNLLNTPHSLGKFNEWKKVLPNNVEKEEVKE